MRPLFIGGCERSGTTMLGAMLGSHSRCICVPESQFIDELLARGNADAVVDHRALLGRMVAHERFRLLWDLPLDLETLEPTHLGSTLPEVLSWLVRAYGRKVGKTAADVWIDHTPTNFRRVRSLLRLFPDARFIHLVRDGRGVAASFLPLDWGPNDALQAAEFWMARCALGLAAELDLGTERIIRVRYEDILEQPESSLRRLTAFAELDYQPGLLSGNGYQPTRYHQRQHNLVGRPPETSRVDGWEQVLSARQVEMFEAEAGDFLETLGYQPKYGLRARPATRVEVFQLRLLDWPRRVGNNLRRRWRAETSIVQGEADSVRSSSRSRDR